jgi:LacI family transcriptional regulator
VPSLSINFPSPATPKQTADFLNPSLTTITQPANEMGAVAAAQLFKFLEKKGGEISNENIIIKSMLTVRGSTK